MMAPNCVLKAIWNRGDGQMKPLLYTVEILGITPDNYFTINIDPGT